MSAITGLLGIKLVLASQLICQSGLRNASVMSFEDYKSKSLAKYQLQVFYAVFWHLHSAVLTYSTVSKSPWSLAALLLQMISFNCICH